LALAACAGIPQPPAASSSSVLSPVVSDSVAATAAESKATGEGERDTAALPPVRPTPSDAAHPTRLSFGQLRGLTGVQVSEMLGRPQFLRHDSAVELWQYRGDGCVLSLFLYGERGAMRVRHAEARPRTMTGGAMNGSAADACLTKLTAAPPAATS
jgi:hypothetical protein